MVHKHKSDHQHNGDDKNNGFDFGRRDNEYNDAPAKVGGGPTATTTLARTILTTTTMTAATTTATMTKTTKTTKTTTKIKLLLPARWHRLPSIWSRPTATILEICSTVSTTVKERSHK